MNVIPVAMVLFVVFLLGGCSTLSKNEGYVKLEYKKIESSDREYLFKNIETCSNLYINNKFKLSVLEVSCSNEQDGLYIYGENYQNKFDWFDRDFNLWAIQEGCNSPESCFYELKVNKSGTVEALKYHFWINLSEGVYRVDVLNKTLQVIQKQVVDQPS